MKHIPLLKIASNLISCEYVIDTIVREKYRRIQIILLVSSIIIKVENLLKIFISFNFVVVKN